MKGAENMKEFRVEFILRNDGSQADQALLNDFVKRVMQIKEDFNYRLTEFSMSEDAVDEDIRFETVCPLCEKAIPQLSYRKIPKGDQT